MRQKQETKVPHGKLEQSPSPERVGKAMVSPNSHARQMSGVTITNRVSALVAWFGAGWARQIAPRLLRGANVQDVSYVYIQSVRGGAPARPVGAEGDTEANRADCRIAVPRPLLIITQPMIHVMHPDLPINSRTTDSGDTSSMLLSSNIPLISLRSPCHLDLSGTPKGKLAATIGKSKIFFCKVCSERRLN